MATDFSKVFWNQKMDRFVPLAAVWCTTITHDFICAATLHADLTHYLFLNQYKTT